MLSSRTGCIASNRKLIDSGGLFMTIRVVQDKQPVRIAELNSKERSGRMVEYDYLRAFLVALVLWHHSVLAYVFVWQSLVRKGVRKYLGGRLIRLGLPFIIGVKFLIPLAYYPAQLQIGLITGVDSSFDAFWLGMVQSGFGTAPPIRWIRPCPSYFTDVSWYKPVNRFF